MLINVADLQRCWLLPTPTCSFLWLKRENESVMANVGLRVSSSSLEDWSERRALLN